MRRCPTSHIPLANKTPVSSSSENVRFSPRIRSALIEGEAMNFSVWAPEVNSLLLLEGPGPEPMLAAAAAWDGIGSELSTAANAIGSVTANLTGQAWQGPSSVSMTTAVARYVDWLGGAVTEIGPQSYGTRS